MAQHHVMMRGGSCRQRCLKQAQPAAHPTRRDRSHSVGVQRAADLSLHPPRLPRRHVCYQTGPVPAVLQRLRLHGSTTRVVTSEPLAVSLITINHLQCPWLSHPSPSITFNQHQRISSAPSSQQRCNAPLEARHVRLEGEAPTARLAAALKRSTLRHCVGMEQQSTAAFLARLRWAQRLCWPCWRAAPAAAALSPRLLPPACLSDMYSARANPQRAARRRHSLHPPRARPAGDLPLSHLPHDLSTSSLS